MFTRLFAEDRHADFRRELLEAYFKLGDDKYGESGSAAQLLTELWPALNYAARDALIDGMLAFLEQRGDDVAPVRAILITERDRQRSHDTFSRVRDVWRETRALQDEDHYRRQVRQVLLDFARPEQAEVAMGQLVGLYREASRLQEEGDYGLYAHLTEVVTPEFLRFAANLHGKGLVLRLLGDIVKDEQVEVTLAALTLGVLLPEYGREPLLLDDELIPSVLKAKTQGDPRMSVVEVLCEGFPEDEGGWNAMVLGVLSPLMNDEERSHLLGIVHRRAIGDKHIALLESYLGGHITIEALQKKHRALSKKR